MSWYLGLHESPPHTTSPLHNTEESSLELEKMMKQRNQLHALHYEAWFLFLWYSTHSPTLELLSFRSTDIHAVATITKISNIRKDKIAFSSIPLPFYLAPTVFISNPNIICHRKRQCLPVTLESQVAPGMELYLEVQLHDKATVLVGAKIKVTETQVDPP